MGRRPGTPKTGGRKKGSKNVREAIGEDKLKELVDVLEDPERMAKELARLQGKDYFAVYFQALQYLRPKFSNIEFSGNVSVGNDVTDKLRMAIAKL